MHQRFARAGFGLALAFFTTWTHAGEKAGPHDNHPPKGFTALFNGKDLTNWQGLLMAPDPNDKAKKPRSIPAWLVKLPKDERAEKQRKADEAMLAHWKVVDGIITYDGKNNSVQTVKEYGNFELYVDWKIHAKGDSGIYLRGQPQVQIWDSSVLSGGLAIDKDTGSGGLWNNPRGTNGQKPLVNADRPVGEWNTFHITVVGDDVSVVLNGKKVVDKAPLLNYWQKEKGKPLPTPARGPVELQHHGDHLWFKNIYVKELPD